MEGQGKGGEGREEEGREGEAAGKENTTVSRKGSGRKILRLRTELEWGDGVGDAEEDADED